MMLGRFVEVCRRRGLKVNANKSKVMLLGGEEGLGCEICADPAQESEFRYLKCVLNRSGTDAADCHRKVARERKVAAVIRSLV